MYHYLKILYWSLCIPFVVSCNKVEEHQIDYDLIERELLQDSSLAEHSGLIGSIIDFYKTEIPNHYSRRISLGSARNMVFIDELTTDQIDSLRDVLGASTRIRFNRLTDSQFIDENYLIKRIRHALHLTEKYPWNQSIPDSIFLNYLLPYKVMDEYAGDWWSFLEPHYRDSMTWWSSPEYDRFDVSNSQLVQYYTTFIMGKLPEWWYYDPMAETYTKYPSLNETLLLRYGGCYMQAMINTLIQRTWGIPATINEVPYWGSQNGSHATEVVWNAHEGKMYDGEEFYRPEANRRPAKIIQYSFRRTGAFTDGIAPYLNGEEFQISQMRGDHWFDVTSVHAPVTNIHYPVQGNLPPEMELVYIYVMNYGDWVPTHFGRVYGDSLQFRDMGMDLIYRVGYYANGNHHLISPPFQVDRNGDIQYSSPDPGRPLDINGRKINHGLESDVESGETYTLQYVARDGEWHDHATQQCAADGELIFSSVPADAFYRLKSPSDERKLARIFMINDDGEQVWY